MTLLEYNIRTCLLFLICAFGAFILLFCSANKYETVLLFHNDKITLKKIMKFLAFVVLFIFSACLIFSVETKEYSKTVTVEECISNGSIGDIIKTYTLITIDDDMNENQYSSPIFCSNDLKKQLEQINKGDKIIIKYTDKMNYIYFVKEICSEQLRE